MTPEVFAILEQLDAAGITLQKLPDGNLLVAPRELLTDALRSEIRASKAALLLAIHPHFNAQGDLVIPFRSPVKFHYWKEGGQSIFDTLRELGATDEQIARHTPAPIIPHRGDAKPRPRGNNASK